MSPYTSGGEGVVCHYIHIVLHGNSLSVVAIRWWWVIHEGGGWATRAFSAHAGQGMVLSYTKGSVIRPRFGAFNVWSHGFFRIMYIHYVTLRCYYIRWWYWSKKRLHTTNLNGHLRVIQARKRNSQMSDFVIYYATKPLIHIFFFFHNPTNPAQGIICCAQ